MIHSTNQKIESMQAQVIDPSIDSHYYTSSTFFSENTPPANLEEITKATEIFVKHNIDSGRKIALVAPYHSYLYHFISNIPLMNPSPLSYLLDLIIFSFIYLDVGTRGAISAENFIKKGYAVIFFHRRFSLQPFNRKYASSERGLLDFFEINNQNEVTVKIDYDQSFKDDVEIFHKAEHKIQSSDGQLILTLKQVPKFLGILKDEWIPNAFVVSFKLETDESLLETKALASLDNYGHQAVVANMLQTRKTVVWIITNKERVMHEIRISKEHFGFAILIPLNQLIKPSRSSLFEMSEEISLSVEETNKLRISLGLKPLSSKPDSKTGLALENFKKHQDELDSEKRKSDLRERIERYYHVNLLIIQYIQAWTLSKNKRESNLKLSGKGIADSDDDSVDDAFSWVNKTRSTIGENRSKLEKKQKKTSIGNDSEQELESYTSENLKGLKVAHNINEIEQGEEEILVLKDQTITQLEELGDELQSEKLIEKDRLAKNAELKKHLKEYGTFGKGYDDLSSGISYVDTSYLKIGNDEENETKFKLGEGGSVNSIDYSNSKNRMNQVVNKIEFSLADIQQPKQADEYYTAQEVSNLFKKKKKKQQRVMDKIHKTIQSLDSSLINSESENKNILEEIYTSKPKRPKKTSKSSNNKPNPIFSGSRLRDVKLVGGWEDELDINNQTNKKKQIKEFYEKSSKLNFIDDDELQEAVSRTRREKLEFNLNLDQLKENTNESIDVYGYGDGLVLSETTEFASNVGKVNLMDENILKDSNIQFIQDSSESRPENINIEKNGKVEVPDENIMEIGEIENSDNEDFEEGSKDVDGYGGTEEEPLIGSGVASALQFLLKKGIVKSATDEEKKLSEDQIKKQKWLLDSKKRELIRANEQDRLKKLRKLDAANKKGIKKSKTGSSTFSNDRASDYSNEIDMQRLQDSERSEKEYFREQEELMKNYKPVVKLEYTDEHGRILNGKQAFKHFAHQFHGVYPGKKKTDKILEKIQKEKDLEQLNSTQYAAQQGGIWESGRKKQSSAHVVLNVGSKPGLNGNLFVPKK
ncbi:Phosphopantothenate-cysteine ligase 2 [Smittium mucronatum]|uniref:Phosphopantothenate-cysteine ligase 2 n=1 Tax=Smittium mucronatum TaxID=133383 RepID=A0A1R0GXL9_9FUNG|nr:Phosphopantothenate-cysteine ligase 2 [Smittium mucronatum]